MRELGKRNKDDDDGAGGDSEPGGEFPYVSSNMGDRGVDRAVAGFLGASRLILKAEDPLVGDAYQS